ncbi:MAG: Phosphopantetheine adenylyltransferase [Chlamydiae bacterium]|nr:Phosphopantetheine adenylyltransferase [Chlamydiota bacterium]
MTMFKGLYAGTFDPPTLGHIEIIKRAAALFEILIVGIGENIEKRNSILTLEERIEALKKETASFSNIEIFSFTGLVTDFAKSQGVSTLIRGLRSEGDMEYEMQMANANHKIGNIETLFLMARDSTSQISSSLIRELSSHGAPLKDYIPSHLEEILHRRTKGTK